MANTGADARLEQIVRECIEAYGPDASVELTKKWPDSAGKTGISTTITLDSASGLTEASLIEKMAFVVEELKQRPLRDSLFFVAQSLETRSEVLAITWRDTIAPSELEGVNTVMYAELSELLDHSTHDAG